MSSTQNEDSSPAPIEEVMVNSEQEMSCVTEKSGKTLVLFKQQRTTTNYWDFVRLAAYPVAGKSPTNYSSSDASHAWCLKCNERVEYKKKSLTGVISHLNSAHPEHLKKSKDSSTVSGGKQVSLTNSFASSLKPFMKKASRADQKKGEAHLVYWIVTSLRPFSIVEDKGFQSFCLFLNSLSSSFKVTQRKKVQEQMMKVADAVSMKVKQKMLTEMDWFSITTDIWTSRTVESFMAVTIHFLNENFEMINFVLEVRQFDDAHTADNIR